MPKEYHITGIVTFDEYLECHKILAAKRRLFVRGMITLYGVGIVIYGFLFAPVKTDITLPVVAAMMIAYGVVISPLQFRYRVKRNWDQYPKLKMEFSLRISEEGIQELDDRGNPSHTNWESFLRFRESNSLFLLYFSPLLPLCLPKRLIPASDLPGLRELLSSAIGKHLQPEPSADATSQ